MDKAQPHARALDQLPRIPGDRYTVIEKLGFGGMGTVVKAMHTRINKPVAIKILNNHLLLDETSIKRFDVEAKAGGQLSHPNLVSVFDYGVTEDGEPYLVMEYVDGKSLQSFLENQKKLSAKLFLLVFEQLCKGLQYIHKHNIVHRDIKTSNIMLQIIGDDLYAKLLDFGIAKVLGDSGPPAQHLTATGTLVGSPLYMSPEQCMGKETDARSDIYSLGCVMYECLQGEPPIQGDNALQTLYMHVSDPPRPLAELNSDNSILRSIAKLTHKCLEKDPSRRFQNTGELLKELSSINSNLRSEEHNSSAAGASNPAGKPVAPSNAGDLANLVLPHRAGSVTASSGLAGNVGGGGNASHLSSSQSGINRWKRSDRPSEIDSGSGAVAGAGSATGAGVRAEVGAGTGARAETGPGDAARANSASEFESETDQSLSFLRPGNTWPANTHDGQSSTSDSVADLQSFTASKPRMRHTEEIVAQAPPRAARQISFPFVPVAYAFIGLVAVAGIYFASPFIERYVQEFTVRSSLDQAEQAFNLGQAHWVDAKAKYLKALEYAQSRKEADTIGKICVRLGRIDLYQGDLAQAESRYTKAIESLDQQHTANWDYVLDGIIGKSEALSRERRYTEADSALAQARNLARKWNKGPLKLGDILVASAKNAAIASKTQDAINYYEQAIAEYSKLEAPPVEQLASAWLESAELCRKLGWTPQVVRRAEQAILISAKSADGTMQEQIKRRAEPLVKLGEVVNTLSPIAPPAGLPLPPSGLPPLIPPVSSALPIETAATDVEILKHQNNLAKQRLDEIKRAEEFNAQFDRVQKRNFNNVIQTLESQSKAVSAGSSRNE